MEKGSRSLDKLETKSEILVLVDGNAIIHRAYHALPQNMSNSRGELTNAVYGFTTTLIKVLEDLKPEHIAASFDLAGPTFRHEQFAEYKAGRVKADQELYNQIPRVKEVVKTMNIPIYEKEGFEADDIIGTIVQKIANHKSQITNNIPNSNSKKDFSASLEMTKQDQCKSVEKISGGDIQIYIVSGDKDIYQLVNGNVKVYSLRRGLSQLEIIDHDTIKKEYNLDPHDFIDLKALAGDPSDNIPGVPGVGPKTATELIQKFDTLEKLYEKIQETMIKIQKNHKSQITNHKQITNSKSEILNNLTIEQFNNEMVENVAKELEIKPRTIKLLLENKDQAFLSQKLATIHRDVPIDFNLEDAKWGDYDKDKLRGLFEELGFRSLLARFGKVEAKSDRKPTEEQKKKDEQLKLL